MLRPIPIGIEDFRQLREENWEYVDKTHLITEFLDRRNIKVIVLPRPRRFGKTLNLSMLRYYFEKRDEDLWHLFEGLHVANAGEKYRKHFQQYPVVHLSFKAARGATWETCRGRIGELIRDVYKEHRPILEAKLDKHNLKDFLAIANNETTEEWRYQSALSNLTQYLHQAYGKRVIVLIDEYDAPIHAGYAQGYYREVVGFFRPFLEAGLKDNPHLDHAALTGILRVSKESIFSGLNQAMVYSILDPEFNTCFGFTDAEVSALIQEAEKPDLMDGIRAYYNGYEFGQVAIYNPWSIVQFLASQSRELRPYWLNTSSNDLVKDLLKHHAFAVEKDIRTLLEGGCIEARVNDNIVFPELKRFERTLWDLLTFTGYLKAARGGPVVAGQPPPPYLLSIPNREVAEVYRTTFHSWMDEGLRAQGGALQSMLDGLLKGDVFEFEEQLQKFAANMPSYHDVRGARPESFYQGLMVGLLASLEPDYEVRSNRESGDGRPDLMIKPRHAGKPGVVLELKSARKRERTIKQALKEGHDQLAKNDYVGELRAAGVETVHAMVVAFDGKRVVVESGDKPKKKPSVVRRVGQSIRKATKKVTGKGR